MFLLHFIPDEWLHLAVLAILIAGVVLYGISFLFRFALPLLPYKEPTRILGTLLMVAGVYFYGSYDTEMAWRSKVAEIQTQINISEQKSKVENDKLKDQLKEKQKVITKTQVVIQERIKEVAKQVDDQCVVNPDVIKILNDAAKK
mgnify:CR=1 FL=1